MFIVLFFCVFYLVRRRSQRPATQQRLFIHTSAPLADLASAEQMDAFQALLTLRHEADYKLHVQYHQADEIKIPLYSLFKDRCKKNLRYGCGCGNRGSGSLELHDKDISIHIIHHGDDLWIDAEASIFSVYCIARIYLLIKMYGSEFFVLKLPLYTSSPER